MLYLIDEDKFNAITKTYKCDFVFDMSYYSELKYFKKEEDIDFDPNELKENDFICFHNSFPNEKTKIINRINFLNEEKQLFHIICFSGDSSFYNTTIIGKEIKMHKDRFYYNLKKFIDSQFSINKILYGDYGVKNEANIIISRMFEILFIYSNVSPFDIKVFPPRDLKRLCELAKYDYTTFLSKIEDITIEQFRNFVSYLNKNI